MKRGTSYITLRVGSLHFKDALNFNCPLRLEKFIKLVYFIFTKFYLFRQWGQQDGKKIFPYEYYHSVRELRTARRFPPLTAFHSNLNGKLTCTIEQYEIERDDFYRRRALPVSHPDHYRHMLDYLQVSII